MPEPDNGQTVTGKASKPAVSHVIGRPGLTCGIAIPQGGIFQSLGGAFRGDALQGMITIAALPFALLMVVVMVCLYRVLDLEYQLERRRAQRARHAVQAWIEREMAAQDDARTAARAPEHD